MKKTLVALVAVGSCAVAAPAQAGTTQNQRIQSEIGQLRAQVTTLRKQVGSLQTQVKKLKKDTARANSEVDLNYFGDACLAALTADNFASTWRLTDQLAQSTTGKTLFGPQTAIKDNGGCSDIEPAVTRNPNAPALALFQALIDWILPA
jgi:outer membrane murein-binding lipoprotein Lpp